MSVGSLIGVGISTAIGIKVISNLGKLDKKKRKKPKGDKEYKKFVKKRFKK